MQRLASPSARQSIPTESLHGAFVMAESGLPPSYAMASMLSVPLV